MYDDDNDGYSDLEGNLDEYTYKVYEEEVREILERMQNDFDDDKILVCQQLPDVWDMHKDMILAVADLYAIYNGLRRDCSSRYR